MSRKITRREVAAFTAPVRAALAELRSGEVHSIRGYAVQRDRKDGSWVRIDWAINGFVALVRRLDPDLPTRAMESIAKKLDAGVVLTAAEIEAAQQELKAQCEAFFRASRERLIDVARTEQINIELESLGIKEAA